MYEVAKENDRVTDHEEGKIFNDRLRTNMFMQVIPVWEYDVLLCPNLNGDYLRMPAPSSGTGRSTGRKHRR
jgi:isocitrate dehydrogenase